MKAEPGIRGPATLNPLIPVLVPLAVAAVVSGVCLHLWFPLDVAKEAGVARFRETSQEAGLPALPPLNPYLQQKHLAPPVLVWDYDGDGHPDLFFPGRRAVFADDPEGVTVPCPARLLHNDGRGRFVDVTAGSGLEDPPASMAAASADFDGDGRPDLFVAGIGGNRLYRNEGGGRFTDVTDNAGLGGTEQVWSSGACWLDANRDGQPDLVVCHQATWPAEISFQMAVSIDVLGRTYGTPFGFRGMYPTLYLNRRGHFTAAGPEDGIETLDTMTGLPKVGALAVTPLDANNDGLIDLLVSHSEERADVFLSRGNGTFSLWKPDARVRIEGAASDLLNVAPYSLASGSDPRWDQWYYQTALSRRPEGEALRRWVEERGLALFDLDHQGGFSVWVRSRERPASGPELIGLRSGRWLPYRLSGEITSLPWGDANGLVSDDFDGDGLLDTLVTAPSGRVFLLKNETTDAGPWLGVDLSGAPEGQALGATVEVATPGRKTVQTWLPSSSAFASGRPVMRFGLGADSRVRTVTVRWRNGSVQAFSPEKLNRVWRVVPGRTAE